MILRSNHRKTSILTDILKQEKRLRPSWQSGSFLRPSANQIGRQSCSYPLGTMADPKETSKLDVLDQFQERQVAPGIYVTDYRHQEPQDLDEEPRLMVALDGADFTVVDSEGRPVKEKKEQQLAPGVYMTDFRETVQIHQQPHKTTFGAQVHTAADQYTHPELASIRIQELEHQIMHLERSNQELETMKEQEPEERLWQETIDENVEVIARKKAEILKIKNELPGHIGLHL